MIQNNIKKNCYEIKNRYHILNQHKIKYFEL